MECEIRSSLQIGSFRSAGQVFAPHTDGGSAASRIPPAFGLAGVNLATYTGSGTVTYWNAFVANLEMHGQGSFFDRRWPAGRPLAGFFAARAGLPAPPGAPTVREFQRAQAAVALPWAAQELGLPPPS